MATRGESFAYPGGMAVNGGWRKIWWKNPLALLGCAVGAVLVFVLLSKLLLVLAYFSGGLLFLLVAIWFLWRWW
jgi:putative Ca2+/H+ antiporter (TMEM165/GDT1 family)